MLCCTNMWDSVSRTLGYGWNVGLFVLQKVSEKVFDTESIEEEDTSFVNDKMPEEQDSRAKDFSHDQKSKSKSDSEQGNNEPISTIHVDSVDETSYRSSAFKKINKNNENHSKISFPKSDNRVRHKVSADVRWNFVGCGNTDKFCISEKLEKSQSDLSTSKWISVANSVKSEFSHKSLAPTTNSSESDLFPSRSGISTIPYESSIPRSYNLFKSSSSSQLPSVKGSFFQQTRPWRYGESLSDRPVSVVSMPQGYTPQHFSLPTNIYPKNLCNCNESLDKKPNRVESILSLAEIAETREGLSWRRLHMSRAKLKATATTSELLSGFAMIAMVELQINPTTTVPEWLFVLFAVCTTVLVAVHIFALMISTYILPNIDAVSKLHVSSLVSESPHDRMKNFIELAWTFSTVLGLFLFLVEIAILCWVKFWDYSIPAAWSATIIIMPVLVLFVVFALHFYHSLVVIKCKTSSSNMQELENMKKQLDNASIA